jgi:hypothetical protein
VHLARLGIDRQCRVQVVAGSCVVAPQQFELPEVVQRRGAQPGPGCGPLQRCLCLFKLIGVEPQLAQAQVQGRVVGIEGAGLLQPLQRLCALAARQRQVAGVIVPAELAGLQLPGIFPA